MKTIVSTLVLATAVLSVSAYAQQPTSKSLTTMTDSDLQWNKGTIPGTASAPVLGKSSEPGLYVQRLKFSAGASVGPHTHPMTEHITVLSGTLNIGEGEKAEKSKTTVVKAGGMVYIPERTPHFVFIDEETVIQQSFVGPYGISFVDPKDDPRKK